MASADDYATWIVQNADKKGTPEFDTVAKAYQVAKQEDAPPAPPEEGALQSAVIGAGKTFTRLGQGVQQAYYGLTGDQAAQDQLKAQVADEQKLYQPLQQAHPLATGIGEALPVLAGGIPTMAGAGALEYGTPQAKAERAAGAVVGGVAGNLAGKVLGRAIQPIRSAASDGLQSLFDKYGMSALPGQITGSAPVNWLTDTLASLPGGGAVRSAVAGQQQGLNKAAMGAMGATADAVTPETVQAAKSALGATFNTVPAAETVTIDTGVAQKLMGIEREHLKVLSPDQRSIVSQYIDDILAYGENGMPGDVYQKARSRIAARAAGTQDSELKTALTGIYKTLDQAFSDSATPDAAAAMNLARQQYRTAKVIEPMANIGGDVSPARLANAAKNLPPAAQDLSQLGQAMRSLPNSGTAQRLFYQSLLSGGVGAGTQLATGDPRQAAEYGAASFAAPWLASKFLTSPAGRAYLTKGIATVSPEVENLLAKLGAGGGGLLGLGLTR